ncbi:MAG: hypothetical protein GXP45_04090 [bacterium]|nr:hypothetical protein [bacterium]
MFYRVGDRNGGPEFPPKDSNVKTDEENRMEIWNNVFMEYYKDESGYMSKLIQQNVDTGMGFGRMCSILQNVDTIFETDLFQDIIQFVEKTVALPYHENEKRMRIVADHLRTVCIMIQDGAIASNTGSGYILRMIIRRMYYNLILMKEIDDQEIQSFVKQGVTLVQKLNPHRHLDISLIEQNILKEMQHFKKTISKGIKILEQKLQSSNKSKILS